MEKEGIKLFYRLPAISFKTYLRENKKYYDGLIINANILAYQKKSVTQFLIKTQKPYIIDPVTYKFNLRKFELMKNGKIQKSIEELSKEYGPTIKDRISQAKSLDHNDFEQNPELIDEIAKNVLAFQKSLAGKPSPVQKYREMLGEKGEKIVQSPIFLIAPYFFIPKQNEYWYYVSQKLAEASAKYKENFELYATILFPRELLYEESFFDSIISDYRAFDGYILWIDGFRENDSSNTHQYDLVQYRKFIEILAEKTRKPIYVMYGSYFSALMGKYGLTGFCSGVRYGESKKFNYSTEEIGPVPFYSPFLKKKIPEDDAARFFKMFPEEMCGCTSCIQRLGEIKSEFPTINDQKLVEKFFENMEPKFKISHFMASRYTEIKNIQSSTISELKQVLQENIQKIDSLKPQLTRAGLAKKIDPEHLKNWKGAI